MFSWIAAVGCCMHAVTLMILRVLSLTGVRHTHIPSGLWLSIDRREADLQDLLFNEPWFFVEGCLWALFALAAARVTTAVATLRPRRMRPRRCGRRVERTGRRPDVPSRLSGSARRPAGG